MNETFDAGSNLLVTMTELIPFADYEIKRFSVQDVSQEGLIYNWSFVYNLVVSEYMFRC